MSSYVHSQLLGAAAVAEKPLLEESGIASIDLGLHTLEFNYHYLLVLLGRTSNSMKAETIQSSKEMLHLLRHLVSDSEEVFNGIVWQLVCCPFTPFLTLFGEILARKSTQTEDEEALAAMKELPWFLEKMGLRNSLAARLQGIASVFVQHAESVVQESQRMFTITRLSPARAHLLTLRPRQKHRIPRQDRKRMCPIAQHLNSGQMLSIGTCSSATRRHHFTARQSNTMVTTLHALELTRT